MSPLLSSLHPHMSESSHFLNGPCLSDATHTQFLGKNKTKHTQMGIHLDAEHPAIPFH